VQGSKNVRQTMPQHHNTLHYYNDCFQNQQIQLSANTYIT
jgi:hypothetical protein